MREPTEQDFFPPIDMDVAAKAVHIFAEVAQPPIELSPDEALAVAHGATEVRTTDRAVHEFLYEIAISSVRPPTAETTRNRELASLLKDVKTAYQLWVYGPQERAAAAYALKQLEQA